MPPKQFKMVRYYGLYAPCKAKKLRAKMGRLAQASGRAIYRLGWRQRIRRDFKRDPWCCPLWASPDGIIHFDDPLRPPQVIKRWPQMVTGPGRIVAVQDPDPPPVQLQPLPVQLGFAFLRSPEDWAHAVVQALGLNDYVHMTMAKPSCYGDDLPAEAWMTNRVYLKPDHKWRNNEVSINEPSNAASSTSASTNEGTELRTKASTSIVQSSRD
jgi:hypothetical protein